MATIYVDPDSGSDANGGTGWGDAKEHIHAAIALITGPVFSETIIKLKANTTNPYEEDVTIKGIFGVSGAGCLIIEPEVWNETNYEEVNGSPFNATPGAGTWDIKGEDKPCELKLNLTVEHARVEIRGLRFKDQLVVTGGGYADVIYCQFDDEGAMAFANGLGGIGLENCYMFDLPFGAVASGKATISLSGNNYIENPFIHGIWAQVDSTVMVSPWGEDPDYYTTEIRVTSPRKEFSAIRLTAKSYMYIKDDDINPWDVSLAQVDILYDLDVLPSNFYGVLLESASIIQGTAQMTFRTKNENGEYVAIPTAQEIVGATEAGALAIK